MFHSIFLIYLVNSYIILIILLKRVFLLSVHNLSCCHQVVEQILPLPSVQAASLLHQRPRASGAFAHHVCPCSNKK